jgi:glycosyltransferase involved in cell wall biosynthesis
MKILSLVIPCYNEEENLPRLIARCAEKLNQEDIEVIFVDNGSTDKTPDLLTTLLADYPNGRSVRVEVNQGYGHGILSGLREAEGEIIGWTHADLQTDPADCIKGLDMFKGSKKSKVFIKGKRFGRPFRDVLFSWGMSAFELLFLGKFLYDINAQPTLFHKDFFKSWHHPPHDFSLDLYAHFLAVSQNLTVKRFPVFFGTREAGVGSNDTFKAKLRFSLRAFRFSVNLRKLMRSDLS